MDQSIDQAINQINQELSAPPNRGHRALKDYKTLLKHTVLDLGHAMGFKVSRLMFEAKFKKKAYKTLVKHNILDLGHALV